jgi:Zn-finger nucleic acid-binding protein
MTDGASRDNSETAGAPLHCPRCATALGRGQFKDVPVDLCGGCRGLLVAQRDLGRLLERMTVELRETIDPDRPIDPLPDRGAVGICPACAGAAENFGYMESNLVRLDRCEACGRLWLDTDELSVMCVLYARTNRRGDLREEALAQARRDGESISTAMAVERALMVGFVMAEFL